MPRYVVFHTFNDTGTDGEYAVREVPRATDAVRWIHFAKRAALLRRVGAYRCDDSALPVTELAQSINVFKVAINLAGSCPECGHSYEAAGPGGICIGCPCKEQHPVSV